ncbi:hypothetical protein ACJX0J_019065, partial [Zea mays]
QWANERLRIFSLKSVIYGTGILIQKNCESWFSECYGFVLTIMEDNMINRTIKGIKVIHKNLSNVIKTCILGMNSPNVIVAFFILKTSSTTAYLLLYIDDIILIAICELGSTIGAVEEVDINSLNSKEIVSGDEDSGKDVKGKSPLKLSSSHANLDEFIKDDEFIPSPTQEKKKLNLIITDEEMKIADKVAARAIAKDLKETGKI